MRILFINGGQTDESSLTLSSTDLLTQSATALGFLPDVISLPQHRANALGIVHEAALTADVVFPLVAGLEGVLEAAGVAYVGSDPTSAGIAANKGFFNDFICAWGFGKIRYTRVADDDLFDTAAFRDYALPIFVKPARLGASIGIQRVDALADLSEAVRTVRTFDSEVVVEESAGTCEVEVAAIAGADLLISEPGLVRLQPGAQWHDTLAKNESVMDMDALAGTEFSERFKAMTRRICRLLRVSGGIRVDYFLSETGRILVGEINCLPGHGRISNFPVLLEASGVCRHEQLARLVDSALTKKHISDASRVRY